MASISPRISPVKAPNFVRWLRMSSQCKTQWLMESAKHDAYFAPILKLLEAYGYHIHHRFYGSSGAYYPSLLTPIIPTDAASWIATQEHTAYFSFASRNGASANLHSFLHELMHFYQDVCGMLLYPAATESGTAILPDIRSHIAISCLCEAMAQTEAIRASWRLKANEHPAAWNGAIASRDWGSLARNYAQDVTAMPEPHAARRCFDGWYQHPTLRYYEQRATHSYHNSLNELQAITHVDSSNFRLIDAQEILRKMPEDRRPDYLSAPDALPLNDPTYLTIQHHRSRRYVQRHEQQYGLCEHTACDTISNASAAHLWYQSVNK